MASVEAQVERLFNRYGPRYRWLATITVMLGTMSVVLASTIINVAIPTIMIEFQLAQDQVHWLATGFIAATLRPCCCKTLIRPTLIGVLPTSLSVPVTNIC